MTNMFTPLDSTFLGFTELFNLMNEALSGNTQDSTSTGYPPMNLYREADGGYLIELAVAGFDRADLSVTHNVSSGALVVTGDNSRSMADADGIGAIANSFPNIARSNTRIFYVNVGGDQPIERVKDEAQRVADKVRRKVIKHGIANRRFTKTFRIGPDMRVAGVKLLNGMLSIRLAPEIADEPIVKVIPIEV